MANLTASSLEGVFRSSTVVGAHDTRSGTEKTRMAPGPAQPSIMAGVTTESGAARPPERTPVHIPHRSRLHERPSFAGAATAPPPPPPPPPPGTVSQPEVPSIRILSDTPSAGTSTSNTTSHTSNQDQSRAPSLREIMLEQEAGRKSQTGKSHQMHQNGGGPNSYAAAAEGNTPLPPKGGPKKQLTSDEVRGRVAELLNTIPKPMERAEPEKILKYKLSEAAAECFGRKTLELEDGGVRRTRHACSHQATPEEHGKAKTQKLEADKFTSNSVPYY
ncbi:hypothetical protein R1sor_021632 [Riccia sorocarpa]|uniref:Uncharacterized protein n=1 Tax=Riccia sorocarpa TaxID=122646 RepID=A0ABD3GJA2_9MARC